MKEVRIKSNFFANIDRTIALQDAASLERQMERMVAAWLRDTGLWGSKFSVVVEPIKENNSYRAMLVTVDIDVDTHPYVVERTNGEREFCK